LNDFFTAKLECALVAIGKILMNRVYWNLFGKIWSQHVPPGRHAPNSGGPETISSSGKRF